MYNKTEIDVNDKELGLETWGLLLQFQELIVRAWNIVYWNHG
jgi:hypothetical protein